MADSINSILSGNAMSPPPLGWVFLCRERPDWCRDLRPASPLEASSAVLDRIAAVNVAVNHDIAYRPDNPTMVPVPNRPGKTITVERWEVARRSGDCDDYAVTKLARLMAEGFPRSALRLAVYRMKDGAYHAVLTVETTAGTLVLSNLTDRMTPWRDITGAWIGIEHVSRFGFMGFAEAING